MGIIFKAPPLRTRRKRSQNSKAQLATERRKQGTGRRAEGLPAGAAESRADLRRRAGEKIGQESVPRDTTNRPPHCLTKNVTGQLPYGVWGAAAELGRCGYGREDQHAREARYHIGDGRALSDGRSAQQGTDLG